MEYERTQTASPGNLRTSQTISSYEHFTLIMQVQSQRKKLNYILLLVLVDLSIKLIQIIQNYRLINP